MADWNDLNNEECMEVLAFLREKARQYAFHEMDEVLGLETDQATSPSDALRLYRQGFADYLRIFSDESLEATRAAFREGLGADVEVPFRVVLEVEGTDREREVDLEAYRRCSELRVMLGHGKEPEGPDKPRNPPRGMER